MFPLAHISFFIIARVQAAASNGMVLYTHFEQSDLENKSLEVFHY